MRVCAGGYLAGLNVSLACRRIIAWFFASVTGILVFGMHYLNTKRDLYLARDVDLPRSLDVVYLFIYMNAC